METTTTLNENNNNNLNNAIDKDKVIDNANNNDNTVGSQFESSIVKSEHFEGITVFRDKSNLFF